MYFLRAAKPILSDIASTFFFLAIYELTHDIRLSIVLGIVTGIAQIAWFLARKLPIAPLQWASLALVLVLGGASLLTQNPRFVMFKPTVIDAVVAIVMAQPGWLARYLPPIVTGNVEPRVIALWARAWPLLMVTLGLLSIVIALKLSFDAWVWFSSIARTAAVVLLFLAQYFTFRRLIVGKIRAERAALSNNRLPAAGETGLPIVP